jgi:hypothetical protein
VEFILILKAAARFRRAWIAVEDGPRPLVQRDPRVIEAMQELMEATETVDLVATFDALGELVRQVDGGRLTML